MQNNDKKYFIPVDGTPIEVSEEIYRAYYQPIWNTRYHAQKNGECRCTKAQLWKCDGVCPGCPLYAAGQKVSIDTPIGGVENELIPIVAATPLNHIGSEAFFCLVVIPFDNPASKAEPIQMIYGHFLKRTHLWQLLALSVGK